MRKMTCIVCPTGCRLSVDSETMTVTGNRCARGLKYGLEEITSPRRTVTSTVRIIQHRTGAIGSVDGIDLSNQSKFSKPLVNFFSSESECIEGRLPVRTSSDVPKEKIDSVMNSINQCVIKTPVHLGDIVVKNIADTGIDLIASRTMLKL